MSADNWMVCPACKIRAEKEVAKKAEHAAEVYGEVPPEEWMRIAGVAKATIELDETFREDYEFCLGTRKGGPYEFLATYSGSCTKCGYTFKFEHRKDLGGEVERAAQDIAEND